MRKLMVLALAGLVAAALVVVGVAQANGSGRGIASVRILALHTNSKAGCISAELEITGWAMYPGRVGSSVVDPDGGHYHVYINGKYRNFGASSKRARVCGLATGRTYQMQVILARNNHSELHARSRVVSVILPA